MVRFMQAILLFYEPPTKGRSVKPKTQKWLVTGLTGIITSGLGRMLANAIAKETPPPEQRSLADDTKEAVFHGVVAVIAVVLASVIVRWAFGRR
jgi:hypothetical protein